MPTDNHLEPVTIIIVNYNSGTLLNRCVQSVLASDTPVKIIVIDNNSRDESLKKVSKAYADDKRLIFIRNSANTGFAHASNQAQPHTEGRYWLYLNPDTVIKPDTLSKMRLLMDHNPDVAMAGPLIVNEDGSEQRGCRRTIPTPWRSFVRAFGISRIFQGNSRLSKDFLMHREPLPDSPTPVEAISGAFMFVRKSAIDEVGLMDEGYFLHCEDLDWCMRFRHKGWQVMFDPNTRIRHDKGGCSGGSRFFVLWNMHKGMVRFYKKFFKSKYPGFLMYLVTFAVWARFSTLVVFYSIKNILSYFQSAKSKMHAYRST